jgi:putative transcriptional regulator
MRSVTSPVYQNRRRSTAVSLLCIATITLTTTTTTRSTTTTTAFVIQKQQHHQQQYHYPKCTTSTGISISMAKNSDRAHIERHLEEMMGDDWREFRARLVARERAEADVVSSIKLNTNKVSQQQHISTSSHTNNNNNDHNTNSKTLNKQGQLGDLFAGAIHSIFHTNTDEKNKKKVTTTTTNSKSIFDGDTIGGVSSTVSSSSKSSKSSRTESSYLDYATSKLSFVEDPFVSAKEVPCHLKSTQTKINKHRWAHDIAHVETGCVLIANEKLGGVFHQTVVLIVQHNDHVGSIGIVINRYVICDDWHELFVFFF